MTSTSIQHHVHAPPGKSSANDGLPVSAPPVLVSGDRNQTVSPPLGEDSGVSVPNPFATPATMPNTVSASSMTSVNWGSPAPSPQSYPATGGGGSPVMIAAAGIRVPGSQDLSTSTGTGSPPPPPDTSSPGRNDKSSSPQNDGGTSNNRRQKRLERNRESARLSRRRRKQYLEVLEDRVNQLSIEMDKGRREHVAAAIPSLIENRRHALQNQMLGALETNLSRTSHELRVAATFQTQQLQSLVFSPHAKFLLWLTLQTDTYFRGGRAASERLSAARIGERMLGSGNNRVPPAHGMWPLLCNEVGLSYDQEERIRTFQRNLVLTPDSWLDRHTGTASGLVMQSTHDCVQSLHHSVGAREHSVMSVLTESQRLKFLQWAENNRERLARFNGVGASTDAIDGAYPVSPTNHEAANLYIINHHLQRALSKLPTSPALVIGTAVKRLSRRPSFESLGSSGSLADRQQKDENRALSRESSFSSTCSLKRSASELELDDEKALSQCVSPEDAEAAAQPTINAALGVVKDIMPLRPKPDLYTSYAMSKPAAPGSTHQAANHPYHGLPGQDMQPQPVMSAPVAYAPPPQQQQPPAPAPMPSFLPQPLNAVPEEEGFLTNQGSDPADDFLFELAEEDWAIGEGFAMDTT